MDPAAIHMHGNAKSADELRMAVERGVGRIVVDNLTELARSTASPVRSAGACAIWLRCNPGVAVHTHAAMATGHLDSKFGLPIETGDAARAVEAALAAENLDLLGPARAHRLLHRGRGAVPRHHAAARRLRGGDARAAWLDDARVQPRRRLRRRLPAR